MKYSYIGKTRYKERVQGTLEATNEHEVRLRLRALQILPTAVTPARIGLSMNLSSLKSFNAINLKGLLVFTRQLSSLVDAGVSVVQAFEVLAKQEQRRGFRQVLEQIKRDIEGGGSLAESLAKHPHIFSTFYVRIVESGEMSGTLDRSLQRIGTQLEKLGRLRSKVIGALIYPSLTLTVALAIMAFMLVKVIPSVATLYQESAASLPEMTVFVLGLSDWVRLNYHWFVIAIVTLVAGGIGLYRLPAFRRVWDPLTLRFPLFGPLIKKSTIASFTRTLSTLLQSGVPILSSFEICVRLSNNHAIRNSLHETAVAVTEGKTIAAGLTKSQLFPPMVIHMVNIGELTGKLDELLGKVADMYDEEVDNQVNMITGFIQPIMIIVVGGIIAFLLLAMYLPIFQLAEKVTGGV